MFDIYFIIRNSILNIFFIPFYFSVIMASSVGVFYAFWLAFDKNALIQVPTKFAKLLAVVMFVAIIFPLRFENKVIPFGSRHMFADFYKLVTETAGEYNKILSDTSSMDAIEQFVIFWFIGAVISTVYQLHSAFIFNKKMRSMNSIYSEKINNIFNTVKTELGIKQNVQLIVQDEIFYPAVTGILKPKILLPLYTKDLDDRTLKYILEHELYHIKNKDLWLNGVMYLLSFYYWYFIPMFNGIREILEAANDEYVIRNLDESARKEYSTTLVTILAKANNVSIPPRGLAVTDSVNHTKRRIELINAYGKTKKLSEKACMLFLIYIIFRLFTYTV